MIQWWSGSVGGESNESTATIESTSRRIKQNCLKIYVLCCRNRRTSLLQFNTIEAVVCLRLLHENVISYQFFFIDLLWISALSSSASQKSASRSESSFQMWSRHPRMYWITQQQQQQLTDSGMMVRGRPTDRGPRGLRGGSTWWIEDATRAAPPTGH